MLSAILQENLKKHLLFCEIYTIILIHAFAKCRRGETGRRNRLKICRGRPRIGSIPIDGTNPKDARPHFGGGRLFVVGFLCSSFCARLFVLVFLCASFGARFSYRYSLDAFYSANFALSVGKEIGANGSVNMVHLLQKLHDTCKVFFLCA